MKLTPTEKEEIGKLRNRYMKALIKRSDNPSDFDANFACLKEWVLSIRSFYTLIMWPHLQAVEKNLKNKEKFNIVFRIAHDFIHNDLKEYSEFLQEVRGQFFTETMMDLLKEEFLKEPRITALEFSENEDVAESYNNLGLYKAVKTQHNEYRIIFSDGTKLIFPSIEDLSIVQKTKEAFDEKMHLLTMQEEKKSLNINENNNNNNKVIRIKGNSNHEDSTKIIPTYKNW